MDYNLTSRTLSRYGKQINRILLARYVTEEAGLSCPYCNQSLRFVKEIVRSQTAHNYSASEIVGSTNLTKSTEPNLLFHMISYTQNDCQLPHLLANAVKLVGSVIEIYLDDELLMLLQVELVKENIQSLIRGSSVISFTDIYPNCFVTLQMTRENTCPLIRISFSEFKPIMTGRNNDIINDLFTASQRSSAELIEICVSDYLDKLDNSTFQLNTNTGSFVFCTKLLTLMSMIGIEHQLL